MKKVTLKEERKWTNLQKVKDEDDKFRGRIFWNEYELRLDKNGAYIIIKGGKCYSPPW